MGGSFIVVAAGVALRCPMQPDPLVERLLQWRFVAWRLGHMSLKVVLFEWIEQRHAARPVNVFEIVQRRFW